MLSFYFNSKIKSSPAYMRLNAKFEEKGYTFGRRIDRRFKSSLRFDRVPPERDVKDYLLVNLSGSRGKYNEYINARPGTFDKQFFKDCIASDYYVLKFDNNIFEWMNEELIDEELVMCAMLRAIDGLRNDERRGCADWFYSVHKRKPELLTEDMYILGARCFAGKYRGENKFLAITPREYLTLEYYIALCIMNKTPVMEDIPPEILEDSFLISLANADIRNVACFTEEALEREVLVEGRAEKMKFWQIAITIRGSMIEDISLNDERIEFFLSLYSKDSFEYECYFKRRYKDYLREKNKIQAPSDKATQLAATAALFAAMAGMGNDVMVDIGNAAERSVTSRNVGLPIESYQCVPADYAKIYDREEYLLEIYKKLGIQVLGERNYYYYDVALPEDATVTDEGYGEYHLKVGGKTVVKFIDRGPFYDKSVHVTDIYCTL